MQGHSASQGQNPLELALAKRDTAIIRTVREAIRHRQVMLAYQPVVRARRQESIAFHEGLIRVLDETGRIVPARDFIETVEDSEDGRRLDCIALELGLRELEREPGLRLAINMSARSIGYRAWRDTLTRGLRAGPTVAERLILEITESSAMLVPELVISFMDEMQARGVAFSLDDFGAGHTALRHFKQFSFDMLKIDGQFIRGIAEDPDNQVMTAAIVDIARQFDMFTVAESVERSDDAQLLAGIGLDCLQGYFFGAPTVSPAWRESARQSATG